MIRSVEEVLGRLESLPQLQNKIAYDHFSEPQQLPFAAYTFDADTDGADDYKGVAYIDFTLELYADPRDLPLELEILKALDDVEITSDSEYIEAERMYQTTFSFRFPYKLTTPKE